MFSIIGRDELTQHFVSLGWKNINYRSRRFNNIWFEKDGLRTSNLESDPLNEIFIYGVDATDFFKPSFFEELPQRVLEGGSSVEIVEWIKEVEAKWHLNKL